MHKAVGRPLICCPWVTAFPRAACSAPAGSSKLELRPGLWDSYCHGPFLAPLALSAPAMARSLPEISRGKKRKREKIVKEIVENLQNLKTLVIKCREKEMGERGKGKRRVER